MWSIDASASEPNIRLRRPSCSEPAPHIRIETARHAVVSDSDSELCAGESWNSVANCGSSGCTAYISEKVEKPAKNSAKATRQ